MDIEANKATVSRLRGHLTRSIQNFKEECEINGDIIEAYRKVNAKISKLEDLLEEMGEKDGFPENYVQHELDNIVEKARWVKEMFKNATTETQVGTEGNNLDLQATITTGQIKQSIPKNNIKKPHELDDNATLKAYEEWKSKIRDFFTLSGMDQMDEKIRVTTLRAYLNPNMHKILQYSIGIKDNHNSTLEEVFDALRKFIRSKRNILLDKIDFERCRQRDGEDFETFFYQRTTSKY